MTSAIAFTTWLLDKIGSKAFEKIAGNLEITAVNKGFKKALSKTSKELQKKYPSVLGNSINDFFSTGEIYQTIYKLLFRDAKVDEEIIKKELDVSTLPVNFVEEFINLLKIHCNENIELNKILSNNKIYISVLGLSEDIKSIVTISNLSYEIIEEIRNILIEKYDEHFIIDEFISKYTKSALKVLSELNFLGLGIEPYIKKNRKKLTDVFVEPNFVKNEEKDQFITHFELMRIDPQNIISLKQIFNISNNIVIIGNPGSGKSVLVKHLICDILEKKSASEIENLEISTRIPLRVELRKYFQFKKINNEGIISYFVKNLEIDYGILNITKNNLETLFRSRKILIFFDGLDEIFDANDKANITNDIESLLSNYPNILSVVTSRLIGYEEAKLPTNNFSEIRILEFDDSQIHQYVNKWYLQEENDSDTRAKEVDQFLRLYKKLDDELIRNPLLLSLIIILFRNNLKLPESKLEIYQSCTKTLVDKWDLTKDLEIRLPEEIAKRKETLFADLAFWQYQKLSSKNVKITNGLATREISKVIVEKLKITDDFITADGLAEKFMDYALRRSLYFDNNFTHKTFLEYFTAYWIFSNLEKKLKLNERNELIAKYIDIPFWTIVLELLINMIDQDQPDTEIIDNLFKYQIETKPTGLPFLLEITPFLQNISIDTTKDLVDAIINFLITEKLRNAKFKVTRHFHSLIYFINHSPENYTVFKNKFYDFSRTLKDVPSLKLLIQLYLELLSNYRYGSPAFDRDMFFDFKKIHDLIQESSQLSFLYYIVLVRQEDRFQDFLHYLKKFGQFHFLKDADAKFEEYSLTSPFHLYLYWQFEENFESYEKNMNTLIENGLSKIQIFKHLKTESYFFYINSIAAFNKFIINDKKDSFLKFILLVYARQRRHSLNFDSEIYHSNSILKLLEIDDYDLFISKAKIKLNLAMYDVDD